MMVTLLLAGVALLYAQALLELVPTTLSLKAVVHELKDLAQSFL